GPGDGRLGVAHAHGVDQYTDVHPPLTGARQGLDKRLALRVVVEDVGFQRNGALRSLNGGNHGRVGLVPTAQDADIVAVDQGKAAQLVAQLVERLELWRRE